MSTVARVQAEIDLKDNLSEPLGKASQNVKKFADDADKNLSDPPKKASAKWREFGDQVGKIGDKLQGLGTKLTAGLTAPILAGLGLATKSAAEFDQSLRNVDSIAKLTKGQLGDLRKEILALSKDPSMRQGPVDLAKGMYDVYSSGFKGAKALDILKVSAQGASAGMTESAISGKTLMAVLNSGIPGVTSSQQAMDVLFKEVDLGVNSFEDLASQLGDVLGTAAAAKVSLQEVTAVTATLTRRGISTAESMTAMNSMLTHIIRPGKEAKDLMDKLGLSYGITALQSKGLTGWLNEAIAKTKGNTQAITELVPEMRGMKAMLGLTNDGGKLYNEMLAQMSTAAGATGKALERQNAGAIARWEQFKARLQATLIGLGDTILPVLVKIGDRVIDLMNKFDALPKSTKETIVKFALVAAAVGPILLAFGTLAKTVVAFSEFMPLVTGAWETLTGAIAASGGIFGAAGVALEALTGPVGLVIAAVVGLVVAFQTNFAGVRDIITSTWDDIKESFSGWIADTQAWMKENQDIILPAWEFIKGTLAIILHALAEVVKWAWGVIKSVISVVLQAIRSVIQFTLAVIHGDWRRAWSAIADFLVNVWQNIQLIVLKTLRGLLSIIGEFVHQAGRLFGQEWGLKSWVGAFDSRIAEIEDAMKSHTSVMGAEAAKQAKAITSAVPKATPKTPTGGGGGKGGGKSGKDSDAVALTAPLLEMIGRSIQLPGSRAEAYCAEFASKVLAQITKGLKVDKTVMASAGDLKNYFVRTLHAGVVDWTKAEAGALAFRRSKEAASGYHVGIYMGDGRVMDVNGQRDKVRNSLGFSSASSGGWQFSNIPDGNLKDKYKKGAIAEGIKQDQEAWSKAMDAYNSKLQEVAKVQNEITLERMKQTGATLQDLVAVQETGKAYEDLLKAAKEAKDPLSIAPLERDKVQGMIDKALITASGEVLSINRAITVEKMRHSKAAREDILAMQEYGKTYKEIADAAAAAVGRGATSDKGSNTDREAILRKGKVDALTTQGKDNDLQAGADAYTQALKAVNDQIDQLTGKTSLAVSQVGDLAKAFKGAELLTVQADAGKLRESLLAAGLSVADVDAKMKDYVEALVKAKTVQGKTDAEKAYTDQLKSLQDELDKTIGKTSLTKEQIAELAKTFKGEELQGAKYSIGAVKDALTAAGISGEDVTKKVNDLIRSMVNVSEESKDTAAKSYYTDYLKKLQGELDKATKSTEDLIRAEVTEGLAGIKDPEERQKKIDAILKNVTDNKTLMAAQKSYDDFLHHLEAMTDRVLDGIWEGGFKNLFNSVVQGIRSMVDDIAKEFLRLQMKRALVWLIGAIGGSKAGGGAAGVLLGGYASGGQVFKGVPTVVGETGREVFVPGMDGRIIPSYGVGASGGGGSQWAPTPEPVQPLVQHVYVNVTTPNLSSFRKSDTQLASEALARAMRSRSRNSGR